MQYLIPRVWISSIGYYGELELSFSQSMQIPDDLKYINDTVLDLSVKALDPERYEFLDFTWSVVEFSSNKWKLQLEFENTLYVSMDREGRDQLILTVKDQLPLLSEEGLYVDNQSTSVYYIPPQITYTTTVANIESAAQDTGKVIGILTPTTLFSTILVGSMSLCWGLINTLQIVSHLPMIEVQIPANAKMIFDVTFGVASFDNPVTVAIEDWALIKLQVFFAVKENVTPISENANVRRELQGTFSSINTAMLNQTLLSNGYESINLRENMILPVMWVILIIFIALCGAILHRLLIKYNVIQRIWKYVKQNLFWNSFIRPGLESYTEIIMALAIRLLAFNLVTASDGISSIIAVVLFITAMIAPIITYFFLYKMYRKPMNDRLDKQLTMSQSSITHVSYMKSKEFNDKFGSLTLNLNVRKQGALLYNVIFMLRRIAILFIIFVPPLFGFSHQQRLLLIILECYVFFYVAAVQPFADPVLNQLDLVNETVILLITYFMIIYSDFVPDIETRFLMGWCNLVLIMCLMAVTIFIISSNQIYLLYRDLKLKYIKYKLKKGIIQRMK